jgi:hypothetical protein
MAGLFPFTEPGGVQKPAGYVSWITENATGWVYRH